VSLHEHHWLLKFARKTLSFAKEVKTPLSFFDRLCTKIVMLAALGVYLVQPKEKLGLLIGAGALIFVIVVIVALATWFKPQNLVFGELGYRTLRDKPSISTPPAVDGRSRPAA
jgi:hypothetical protein